MLSWLFWLALEHYCNNLDILVVVEGDRVWRSKSRPIIDSGKKGTLGGYVQWYLGYVHGSRYERLLRLMGVLKS